MESKKELDWSGCGSSDVWCLPRLPIRSKSGMACSTLYAIISQQWFYYSVSMALGNSTWLTFVTCPRAVVEEVVLPEGLKFPLENWDEFEEREHHLSSEQLQSNVVSYIL